MKKVIVLFFLFTLPISVWVHAAHPWLGKTLSANEVKKRWGNEPLDEIRFKTANPSDRAKMAYSLMSSQKWLGLSVTEIRSRLGNFDGHYFSESYPTYLIQKATKVGEESWQVVFLLNSEHKTKQIIVHKNCCE
jgi:hypothetical protein